MHGGVSDANHIRAASFDFDVPRVQPILQQILT
jgi:hypothetical protein